LSATPIICFSRLHWDVIASNRDCRKTWFSGLTRDQQCVILDVPCGQVEFLYLDQRVSHDSRRSASAAISLQFLANGPMPVCELIKWQAYVQNKTCEAWW
jgi:hypothetical protein